MIFEMPEEPNYPVYDNDGNEWIKTEYGAWQRLHHASEYLWEELLLDFGPLSSNKKARNLQTSSESELSLCAFTKKCGLAARENGWHNRWEALLEKRDRESKIDYLVAKTSLIGCEVSEMIEELRGGYAPNEIHFSINDKQFSEQTADAKPEGFPTELADVIIRALDLAFMLDIDIEEVINLKLDFNKTRGKMHGGKAI